MSVYVDQALWRLGRMHMCHMMADTSEELMAMAVAIGMRPEWLQHPGEPDEHFDISKSKRAEAVRLGAIEVSSRDLVRLIRARRPKPPCPDCENNSGWYRVLGRDNDEIVMACERCNP